MCGESATGPLRYRGVGKQMATERKDVIVQREQRGAKEHVRIIETETGELLASYWEETRAKPTGKPPGGRDAEFMRLYRTNWVDIARNKRLTPHDAGVFMFLCGFVKWESNFLVHPDNGENLTISSIAQLLGIDRSNISDCVNRLNRAGFVAILKRGDGRENNILINSNVAFFGKYLKDMSEHATFDNVEYKPAVRIRYKEPPVKEPKIEA